ncbi:TIGR04282 family arsenosugar biosynthesis glycosyltransferase [Flavobacterium muglaense]|uniref:DUF2064 domain-containing protein n=1 Tax=Flavobacterium muglaense TaxID=2764716 RepID=A0A923N2J3_9FLAO|nr:DUF2064 domain-containing protein [Flavobacterium muglaense]MBC5839161.1 DUF2064 domain-containing protein [Flavobacterium muglaense]MBC5845625.1 DUF2064 domain-containing protein [Flavobacterium muglaense]
MNLDCKHTSSTAILLFAQSNTVESALKPIAYRKKQNEFLWGKMNQKVIRTIQKTKLPYFISDENSQHGNTFGQRLSHAIQTVFEQGFDNVIVVGNDSPGLSQHHLLKAKSKLALHNWVFGPDCKGGTYLIGVSKTVFDQALFAKINWQTPKVLHELKAIAFGSAAELTPLSDFNCLDDLKKLLRDFSFYSCFSNTLLSLLLYQQPLQAVVKKRYTFEIIGFNFNKGSPVTA